MIEITKAAFNVIRDHARHELPKEACGIIAGSKKVKSVTKVFKCTNVDVDPTSTYTIAPQELLNVTSAIEEAPSDLELLGFYHSHPFSSPEPSFVDHQRAAWDGFFYLIYSVPQDEVRCWRWSEESGRFVEEDVKIL